MTMLPTTRRATIVTAALSRFAAPVVTAPAIAIKATTAMIAKVDVATILMFMFLPRGPFSRACEMDDIRDT